MKFECIECGYSAPKWLGKCPVCNTWDSFKEKIESEEYSSDISVLNTPAEDLSKVGSVSTDRILANWDGFDRLLGGGLVRSEVLLLAGPPGVGKSTMFLQLAENYSEQKKSVLFISGEENPSQLKLHAQRLGLSGKNIFVIGNGNVAEIESVIKKENPDIVFIDSIQAVIDPTASGQAGSVSQVKKSCQRLVAIAKNSNTVILISGQITKSGDIAGPKILEHMVDAVLYIEYSEANFRLISSAKNRFGACGDYVIYSLTDTGLVENTDDQLIEGQNILGQASTCVLSGTRMTLLEIQALTTTAYYEFPQRRTSGYPRERLLMLIAILEKNLGLRLNELDVYLNVIGSNKLSDRQSDLAVAAAIYSSLSSILINTGMLFVGELGLDGSVKTKYGLSAIGSFAEKRGVKSIVTAKERNSIKNNAITSYSINKILEIKKIIK